MKDRIRLVRKNNSLTQTEFADRINATRAMIASYEGGAVTPSDSMLKLICKEFNVSYTWLKTGEGPMEDPTSDRDTLDKLTDVYQSLPERLKSLVDVLVEMDPEWWKTLDEGFAEIERRKKGDAD